MQLAGLREYVYHDGIPFLSHLQWIERSSTESSNVQAHLRPVSLDVGGNADVGLCLLCFSLICFIKITNIFFPFDDETAFSFGLGRTGDQGRGHEVSGRGSNAASGSSGPSVF
jgi:hypothetical protein